MKISFTKMHGAGNDFVVLDNRNNQISLSKEQYRFLADRHFGIGADQILLIESSLHPHIDFRYRIFNADGGEVEQCGNGARAFMRYVTEKKLTDKRAVLVETMKGIIELILEEDNSITVNMGVPILDPHKIPFLFQNLESTQKGQIALWTIDFQSKPISLTSISMGNPHATIIIDSVEKAPVLSLGPFIENHPVFPERINVGFLQIIDSHHAKLRVYERGAGETLACGSGACAATVSGILQGHLISPVTINMAGGTLKIAWDGPNTPVMMSGPATIVFSGEIDLS